MTQSTKAIKGGSIAEVISAELSDINSNISAIQTTVLSATTPKIASITYAGDDTAADISGGQTLTITGTGFASGATVLIGSTAASVVTVISATSITFTSPVLSAGSYILYVINTDGGTGISVPGVQYSGTPAWTTTAGTLGSQYETSAFNRTVAATGDAPVTYSLVTGTLPTGATLNANGTITGTSVVGSGSPTTYTFTIAASDAQNQDTNRQFSITINPDVLTWSAPANASVITSYEYSNISNVSLSATSAAGDTVTYSSSGLPTGISLSGSTISGTSNTVANTTATITATGNSTTRTSSETIYFNVQQDVVTWTNPTANATITLDGTAYSNTLSATSAAGKSVSYSANTLPTGLSLTSDTISGTPTTAGNVTTLLTATAATTNRTATTTVTWVINLGDVYWKYTSMLLSGSTPTTTFINDASLNNSQLTIAGDTKPNNFHPYSPGYYSWYIPINTGAMATVPVTAANLGSGDFTIEMWINTEGITYSSTLVNAWSLGTSYTYEFYINGSRVAFYDGVNIIQSATGVLTIGAWYHVAVVRSGSTITLYSNGVSVASGSSATTMTPAGTSVAIGGTDSSQAFGGYISNVRIVKGTAVYTSAFTPPTTPLTAITNTILLTAQSPMMIDNSVSGVAVSLATAGVKTTAVQPFPALTTVAYNTLYSTQFDGTGDYLTVPNNSGLYFTDAGNNTFECWINVPNFSTTKGIIWNRNGATGWSLVCQITTGYLFFATYEPTAKTITSSVAPTLNAWNHIALVRSGSTVTLYLNGVSVGTVSNTSGVNETTQPIYIGSQASGGNPFTGWISNVRFVKGTAVYTTNFTPPTSTLTAISGTQLLTCQNATLIDNSPNALAITSIGDAKPIAVSSFTMTTSNTTVTSLGSTYFNGSSDYVTFPSGSMDFLHRVAAPWTIECWFYASSVAVSKTLFSTAAGSNSIGSTLFVGDTSSGDVGFTICKGTAGTFYKRTYTAGGVVTVNTWNHIAVTHTTGGTLTIYVNGVNTAYTTVGAGTGASSSTATYVPAIGRYQDASPSGYFSGYISNMRVVNGTALYSSNFLPPQTPLTPVANTQLLTLQYNGGANNNGFVDQSSFNNIITRTGNVTQGTFSPFSQNGWSNYFDGTGDSLKLTDDIVFQYGTGDFTIEFWLFLNKGGVQQTIFDQKAASGQAAPTLFVTSSNYLLYDVAGTSIVGNALSVGQWYHIAVSRQSSSTKLFVSGTQVGSDLSDSRTYINGTARPIIGVDGQNNANYNFNGYVSNLRILKGTSLYNSSFTPSKIPLSVVANTSLLTCQSNRLIDNSPYSAALTQSGDVSVQAFSPFGGVTSVPTSYSNYFDGTGDYLQMTEPAAAAGDVTVECWIYPTVTAARGFVVSAGTSSSQGAWALSVAANNSIEVWIDGYSGARFTTSLTVSDFAWSHLALVKTSGVVKCYVNGVLDSGSFTQAGNFGFPTSSSIFFGLYSISLNQLYTGYISNFRYVQSTALYSGSTFTVPANPLTSVSGTKVLTCQSATVVDNSTNNFSITAFGDVKPKSFNPFGTTNTTEGSYTPSVNGGSMYFDGTGDYLQVPNPTSWGTASDFTIEHWFYPTSLASIQSTLSVRNDINYNAGQWYWYISATSGTTYFYLYTVNGSSSGAGSGASAVKLNQWNHLAVCRKSGTLTMYMNGVRDTGTLTNNTTDFSIAGVPISIGRALSVDSMVATTGYITDVKITKGVALYSSSFYPPVAPSTPTTTIGSTTYTSTLLLNGTSGGIIDAHSTNNLETVGNTQLASEDPYAGSYYSNYFDGTGDRLTFTGGTPFNFGSSDFTVEAWVNAQSFGNGGLVFFGNFIPSSFRFVLYLSSTGVGIDSGGQFTTSGTTTCSLGTWYHCAVIKSGTSIKTFVNGVQISTATAPATYWVTANTNVTVGDYSDDYSTGYGYISNLRVIKGQALYSGTFTPSTGPLTTTSVGSTGAGAAASVTGTVSLLTCQSNKFIDNSSNNAIPAVSGNLAVKSMNPFQQNTGKSIYFDGTGDYMISGPSTAYTMGTGNFTVECWIYSISNTAGSGNGIFDFNTSAALGSTFSLVLVSNQLYDTGTGVQGSTTIVNGTWNHVALVRASGTQKTYLNGIQQTTGTVNTNQTQTYFFVGAYYSTSNLFNGYIKDIRITKGVARYTTTFTPPTTPLVAK